MTDRPPVVWLADADDRLRGSLVPILVAEGFVVESFCGGRQVSTALDNGFPDILILEARLPDMAGVELCRAIRANPRLAPLPIMIITADHDAAVRHKSFAEGADDFMTKPLDTDELIARVRNRLRRASSGPLPLRAEPLEIGSLRLDPVRCVAFVGAFSIRLTPTECTLLGFLMRRQGVPASTTAILSEALDYPTGTASPVLVRTHIRHLRAKLEAEGGVRNLIRTTPRVGYYLDSTALPAFPDPPSGA